MDDHEQDIHLKCDSDDCASGKKNRYYTGKRMRPASFEVEQTYLVERRRLINRAIHGWGVAYGFDLHYKPAPAAGQPGQDGNAGLRPGHATIEIGEGMALDRAGRELVQVGEHIVTARDVYMSKEDQEWLRTNPDVTKEQETPAAEAAGGAARPREVCWLLNVHYAERNGGPVRVKDDCNCERPEWDYSCETVRYSLKRVDAGRCDEGHPCELGCHCTADDPCRPKADSTGRGSHQCMSRYLSRLDPNAEHIDMAKDGAQLRFDRANGIALARVGLRWHCDAPEFTAVIDECGPRRLVKRNDLLFDLIRGCDLTRISQIGWKTLHRRPELVEWTEFASYFEARTGNEFKITFSGPVQRATVTVDCFAMTVAIAESSGWGDLRRVPIASVRLADPEQRDPRDSTRSATLIFGTEWLNGELAKENTHSLFSNGTSRVEIEVRTCFILDMCGQSVDGNPIGARPAPTGNGSPGGRYLSTFRVKSRPRPIGEI
jgi:hypothetical protein